MPRTNFLPFIVLMALLAPFVYVESLRNSPSDSLPGYGLIIYCTTIAGPLLLVFGFITYRYKQHRVLAWIAFVIGGSWLGLFMWSIVATV